MKKKISFLLLGTCALLLSACDNGAAKRPDMHAEEPKNLMSFNANEFKIEKPRRYIESNLDTSMMKVKSGFSMIALVENIEPSSINNGYVRLFSFASNKYVTKYLMNGEAKVGTFDDNHGDSHDFGVAHEADGYHYFDVFGNEIYTSQEEVFITNIDKNNFSTYDEKTHKLINEIIEFTVTLSNGVTDSYHYVNNKYVKGEYKIPDEKLPQVNDKLEPEKQDLTFLNLPGYFFQMVGDEVRIIKDDKIIKTYDNFANSMYENQVSFFCDGYAFVQSTHEVTDFDSVYDVYNPKTKSKFNVDTYKFDILTGERTKVNFPYLIKDSNRPSPLKNAEGNYQYNLTECAEILADKTIGTYKRLALDKNLMIVNDYSNVDFDNLYKFGTNNYYDQTHSIVYDAEENVVANFETENFDMVLPNYKNSEIVATKGDKAYIIDNAGTITAKFDNVQDISRDIFGKNYLGLYSENAFRLVNLRTKSIEYSIQDAICRTNYLKDVEIISRQGLSVVTTDGQLLTNQYDEPREEVQNYSADIDSFSSSIGNINVYKLSHETATTYFIGTVSNN